MFVKITDECYVNVGEGPIEMVEIDRLSMTHENKRVMLRFRGDGHGKILPSKLTIEEVVEKLNEGLRSLRLETKPPPCIHTPTPYAPYHGGPQL